MAHVSALPFCQSVDLQGMVACPSNAAPALLFTNYGMEKQVMVRGEPAKEIEAMIKSQIQCRLGQPVTGLCVEIRDGHLVISGRLPSYYAKQLAQHVAMNVSSLPLFNEIEVGNVGSVQKEPSCLI
jgi:hypothetical protein